ncbi:TIGR02206 family membrane protein [Spirochaetota bacterium]
MRSGNRIPWTISFAIIQAVHSAQSHITALLTPELTVYSFPHYKFFQFFISHGSVVLSVIYMTFIHSFRPHLKSIAKAFVITIIYTAIIAGVNLLVKGNYLFICRPPDNPSLIDYLGPWPWYVASLSGVAIALFFTYNTL